MGSFEEWKKKTKEKIDLNQTDSAYNEWLQALNELAHGIESDLQNAKTSNIPFSIDVEPGYAVNLGQQFNVKLSVNAKQPQTLFRAYIPVESGPISLDFYDEEPVKCNNTDEMFSQVYEFFKDPVTKANVSALLMTSKPK